jgi:hypothetical protein
MKKITLFTILISFWGNLIAQKNIEEEYPFPCTIAFHEGEKDTSSLKIETFPLTDNDSVNLIGTVLEEYNSSTDSVEYDDSWAIIKFWNKTDTIEFIVDESFNLTVPLGKYKMEIKKVGVGKIERKIKFNPSERYSFSIVLISRRTIENQNFRCKTKKDKRILRRIMISRDSKFKDKCNCKWTGTTIYG